MLHRQSIVETPPPGAVLQQHWATEDDTAACARALARAPQARNATVTLHGDLGAGKTTFVRHLLRALGVSGRIKSPTYAVVEPHETLLDPAAPPWRAWHFDFYRFDDPREWEDAGFRDLFASPGLKLVEWPEKAGDTLPTPDLRLVLQTDADGARQVTLTAGTPHGMAWLQTLEPAQT
jgi:tRNA threonylcarbamoyladenosine biosynthesis protein TsaE